MIHENTKNKRSSIIAKGLSFLSSLFPSSTNYEIVVSIQQQQSEINQSVNQQLSSILQRLDALEAHPLPTKPVRKPKQQ